MFMPDAVDDKIYLLLQKLQIAQLSCHFIVVVQLCMSQLGVVHSKKQCP